MNNIRFMIEENSLVDWETGADYNLIKDNYKVCDLLNNLYEELTSLKEQNMKLTNNLNKVKNIVGEY